MAEVESIVKRFFDKMRISKKMTIGVAFSGGADSLALAMAISEIGYKVAALHVNFHLRGGESDEDATFCRKIADDNGWDYYQLDVDAAAEKQSRESIEMVCRRLRYEWFEKMAEAHQLHKIAIAHHREDVEETMLLNLLRGTGIAGLRGIQSERGIYIRPLLTATRKEIEKYLERRGESWRVDSSNLTSEYRRNALRNEVLPLIRQFFPDADKGILTTIKNITDIDEILSRMTDAYLKERYRGDKLTVKRGDEVEIFVRATARCFPPGINRETAIDILRDVERKSVWFQLTNGRLLLLHEGRLTAKDDIDANEEVNFRAIDGLTLPIKMKATLMNYQEFLKAPKTKDRIYLDADAIGEMVVQLRHPHFGDVIEPYGMTGRQMVSKILKEANLDLEERAKAYLLVDDEYKVLWVAGYRTSRHYQVSAATQKILCLQILDIKKIRNDG